MVKIEKSSNEFNRFLSRICIAPGHAASFTGLDKLYHMVKNHFPAVARKEIRKWADGNLSSSLHIKAVTSCSTHKIDQQETDG